MIDVVCMHASASSGRQWQSLTERLAGAFRVVAPGLYGSGASPQWPDGRQLTIDDELAALEPVLSAVETPFHLVGHSYGGAVALRLALADPGRIRSLVIFEPVLFGLLVADDATQPAAREILAVAGDMSAAVERDDLDAAGERFIDYWMGAGTWATTPPQRRAALGRAMRGVRPQWPALFTDPVPLAAYAALRLPTLFVTGDRTADSARGVARLLMATLPELTTVELSGAGHMGPVTHADLVNDLVEEHLKRWS